MGSLDDPAGDAEAVRKFQKELNAGIVALLALAVVAKARRPTYGYAIAAELAGASEQGLPMNQGALYPVLRSLERSGLLTSFVEPSVAGPPRKYYSATPLGREALARWAESWRRTRRLVDLVLEEDHVRPASVKPRRGPKIP